MLHLSLMICGIQPSHFLENNQLLFIVAFVALEALLISFLYRFRKQLLAAYREEQQA